MGPIYAVWLDPQCHRDQLLDYTENYAVRPSGGQGFPYTATRNSGLKQTVHLLFWPRQLYVQRPLLLRDPCAGTDQTYSVVKQTKGSGKAILAQVGTGQYPETSEWTSVMGPDFREILDYYSKMPVISSVGEYCPRAHGVSWAAAHRTKPHHYADLQTRGLDLHLPTQNLKETSDGKFPVVNLRENRNYRYRANPAGFHFRIISMEGSCGGVGRDLSTAIPWFGLSHERIPAGQEYEWL
ncbi:hypothetical protein FQR65_LT17722 [Abscondita terminalis]|nr:hypothetical protein FQR65_LT17722 [Abscondita terminalis]